MGCSGHLEDIDVMRKFILNILLLVGIAGAGVLAAWLVKSGDRTEDTALSPEDTVKAFYSALLAGDWEKAGDFCVENREMEAYCRSFMDFWNRSEAEDSLMLATASGILSEAEMTVSGGGYDGRKTYSADFRITTDGGAGRTRFVELRKVRGVWLLDRIAAER